MVTVAAAVLSIGYALLQKNTYTATATVLPISGSSSSLLSQYANIASLAGVSLPSGASSDPSIKIQAILKSRSFAEDLISRLNLVPLLIEHPEKIKLGTPLSAAVEIFGKNVFSVSTDAKTSLMTITVKSKSPTLSSIIANGALDRIQENLASRVLSASGKNIVILEQQTSDQEQKVRTAQDKLQAYQKKYKLVSPQVQSTAGLQIYQALVQQKMTLEIEISRLESALSEDNPKIVAARSELDAVQAQMANFEKTGGGVGPSVGQAPGALMEYANITAELELATKVYGALYSNLETVKLQEASEKVFVEVIDRAIPPEKKSGPARSMICVVGTMAGGFLSVLLVFVLDALGKLTADPEIRAKFSEPEQKKPPRRRGILKRT